MPKPGEKRSPLDVAAAALMEYKKSTVCGYCRENADILVDSIEAIRETEEKLADVAMVKLKHPGYMRLGEMNKTVHGVRDMALREAERGGTGHIARLTDARLLKPMREELRDIADSLRPGLADRFGRRRNVR